MNAKVIHNYIDNRIRVSIYEKKNTDELIRFLEERIEKAENPSSEEATEKTRKFKSYLASFSKKRINDINFIINNENLISSVIINPESDPNNIIPNGKLLDLIRLKDKLHLFETDFDL